MACGNCEVLTFCCYPHFKQNEYCSIKIEIISLQHLIIEELRRHSGIFHFRILSSVFQLFLA